MIRSLLDLLRSIGRAPRGDDAEREPKAPPRPSTATDEEIAAVIEAAKAELRSRALPAVALEPRVGEPVPEHATSSLGGRPSLAPDEPWPTDDDGVPMLFIAQLAFAELPKLDGYPADGLLSFFVCADELLGSSRENNCRVLWHPTVDGLERRADPTCPLEHSPFGDSLLEQGAPLTGRSFDCLPRAFCSEAVEVMDECAAKVPIDNETEVGDGLHEWLEYELEPPAHWFGGYACFTQNEYQRSPGERLLLHLGWDPDVDRPWRVCWGDAGDANFIGSSWDVDDREFDDVFFMWDCS